MARGAEDHDGVGSSREILEEGPHRRHSNAAGDQERVLAVPNVTGERAVGSLDGDPGADLEVRKRCREVAHRLDGQSEMRWPWPRRQRERMGLPPHAPRKEPPLEELPTGNRQPIERSTLADDRGDARCLLTDVHDDQAMPEGAPDGESDSIDEYEPGCGEPEQRPHELCQRMADEGRAERDDVGERECERQVHAQVHRPPSLAGNPTTDRADGHDADREHDGEADRRSEHVRERVDQDSDLVHGAGARGLSVPDCEENRMGDEQGDRPRRKCSMPA